MANEYKTIEVGDNYNSQSAAQDALESWRTENLNQNEETEIDNKTARWIGSHIFLYGGVWVLLIILLFIL